MVQHGGSTHASRCPPSRQCFFWQVRSQYSACLHRAHLLRSAGSPESSLPHRAHAQRSTAVRGAADAPGSAAVLLEAVAVRLLPLGGCTGGSVAVAVAVAVAAKGVASSRGGGTGRASPPSAPAAAATHAEHLRALAVLFFWLLVNWSGANSARQTEHRMACGEIKF